MDELWNHAADILEAHYGPTDPRLLPVLQKIIGTNYYIASHILEAKTNDYEEIRTSTLKVFKIQPR